MRSASPRRGPTTTSDGAACPTARGTPLFPCWRLPPEVTQRVRIGTLVATPNIRHPVTLARDALALDDLSEGRLDLGVGPGERRARCHSPRAGRVERDGTHGPLRGVRPDPAPDTRWRGRHPHHHHRSPLCSSRDAQHARAPCRSRSPSRWLQADGVASPWRRSTASSGSRPAPVARARARTRRFWRPVRAQTTLLESACAAQGRDPATIAKVLLWTPVETVITSVAQFDELAAPYEELGFDQLVLHHPQQTGPYSGSLRAYEEIAARRGGSGR